MAEADVDTGSVGGQPPEEELVFTSVRGFLQAIHPSFLQTVYPFDSYLVDNLRARAIFDSDDEGSIRAEKSRRDQARRCWNLLNQVPPSRFHHCLPALKACCSYVVGRRTFCWDGDGEGCFRHLIQRSMSLRRFADTFPAVDGCSQEEYRRMTEGSDSKDAMWDKAFKLCCKNKDNEGFLAMMETTLRTASVPVPDDLKVVLGQGLRCSCQDPASKGQKRKTSKKRKKRSRKRSRKSHDARDSHSDSENLTASPREAIPPPQIPPLVPAARNQGCTPEGPPAAHTLHSSEDGVIPSNEHVVDETVEEGEEEQDCPFESEEKKEIYLQRLGELNKAITQASSIKVLYQEATGIQLELQALAHTTETEPTESRRLADRGKALRLRRQVKDVQDNLEKAYKEASQTGVESGKMTTGGRVWDQHEKTLQGRKEVLVSELTQAEDFYHQSLEMFHLLNQGHGSQEQSQETAAETEDALLFPETQRIEVSLDTVNKQIAEQDDDPDNEDYEDSLLGGISHASSPVRDDGDEEEEEADEDFGESGFLYDFSGEEYDDDKVSDLGETSENDDIFHEVEQNFDGDDVVDGYDDGDSRDYCATLDGSDFGDEEDLYDDDNDDGW